MRREATRLYSEAHRQLAVLSRGSSIFHLPFLQGLNISISDGPVCLFYVPFSDLDQSIKSRLVRIVGLQSSFHPQGLTPSLFCISFVENGLLSRAAGEDHLVVQPRGKAVRTVADVADHHQ